MHVSLCPITEKNWTAVAALRVTEAQRGFVADAIGILARGYVYRACRARVWVITVDKQPAGLMLVRDLDEAPACYDLQQFMVDARWQGSGIGQAALEQLLILLRQENRYPAVEVCVNRSADAALHVYAKAGFADTGYADPDTPESLNLACPLS